MSASVKDRVDREIAENAVMIYSKSHCSYCKTAKKILLEATDDKAEIVELDEIDEGSAIQAYLRELNGQYTVPQIYIRQQFVGGCSDLQKLDKKELHKRIAAA